MSSSGQESFYSTSCEDCIEEQEIESTCDQDDLFPMGWEDFSEEEQELKSDTEDGDLSKESLFFTDTVLHIGDLVPMFSWECSPEDDHIDLTEPMDFEIATHDGYGLRIPSPSDLNWNLLESVPVTTTTTSHQKVATSNEDGFSTWWALRHKKYRDMLPVVTNSHYPW